LARRSSGENINHVNAVRIRLVGVGNLKLKLQSLQNVIEQDLLDLPMSSVINIQPTRLANFKQQRMALQGRTTEINEYFKINRIVIFAKPSETSYPG